MDDLISRKKVIDALAEIAMEVLDGYGFQYDKWREFFTEVPSAQPDISAYSDKLWKSAYERGKAEAQRIRGRWIPSSPVTMKCDQCGFVIKDWDWHRFKFCPNCCADMRGERDEFDR